MGKNYTIQSKVTKKEFEDVNCIAKKNNRTVSNFVRFLILKELGGK